MAPVRMAEPMRCVSGNPRNSTTHYAEGVFMLLGFGWLMPRALRIR